MYNWVCNDRNGGLTVKYDLVDVLTPIVYILCLVVVCIDIIWRFG